MIVRLSEYETLVGAQVGMMRNIQSIKSGKVDFVGGPPEGIGWNIHVEGACGEMAVAKAFGVYWNPTVNTYQDGGDVGDEWQVRTRSRDDYELYVRPRDLEKKADKPFILVTGAAPRFRIVGWMIGKDAKRDKWWQMHGGKPGAWFVPQSCLRPLGELR
jgi:hypothetical protein